MRTMIKRAAAVAALGLASLALATPADAADDAQVSVLHGVPGVTVDVYANGDPLLTDFEPGTLTDPVALPAGDYDLKVVAAGDGADGDAVIEADGVAVPAGANLTVVAHLTEDGTPVLTPFANDVSAIAPGQARLTVRHTAAAPAVDVRAAETPVFTDLTNPNEDSAELPAGTVCGGRRPRGHLRCRDRPGRPRPGRGGAHDRLRLGQRRGRQPQARGADHHRPALRTGRRARRHRRPGSDRVRGPAVAVAGVRRRPCRCRRGPAGVAAAEAAGAVIWRQRTPWGAVTIAVAALLGALLAAWLGGVLRGTPTADAGRPASSALPPSVTEPSPAPEPTEAPRPVTTPVPTSLVIPRLGIRMPVQPAGVDRRGDMALPRTPYRLSWYRFGPRPLDRAGATVLAGHLDTVEDGVGPLARLGELRAGDVVEVRAGRRTVTYRVDSVTRIAKAVLDLPAIFSRTGAPRLHLLTCGGAYLPDQGGYQDNVVVAASRD